MGSVYRLLFQKSYLHRNLYTPRSSPTQNVLQLLTRNYHLIRNNGEEILGRRASAIVSNESYESHPQLLEKIRGVNFMDVIRYKYVSRETRVYLHISNLNGPIIEEPEDEEEPAAAEMEEEDNINAPGIKYLEEDDSDLERLAEMGVVEQRSIWITEPEEEEEKENTPANEVEEEENTPANEEEENIPANEEENTVANEVEEEEEEDY